MPVIRPVLLRVDPVVDDADPPRIDRRVAGEDVRRASRAETAMIASARLDRRSARRSSTARSRRRAAPPSTAAAARGCARWRRAGWRGRASPRCPAEVRVPGVAVDERRRPPRRRPSPGRPRSPRSAASVRLGRRARPTAGRRRPAARESPVAARPSSARSRRRAGELPREVLDVHAGAAVDLGRVLAGEQSDLRLRRRHARPCRSRRSRRARR